MKSLPVFNSLFTGDTVSNVGIFDPALWTIATLTFSLVHTPHPSPPSQSQCTVLTVCAWEVVGGGGGCWVVLVTIFCRSLTTCFWPDSEPTQLLYHPKPKRAGGLREINTCCIVPLQVNFFRQQHLELLSSSLISLRITISIAHCLFWMEP